MKNQPHIEHSKRLKINVVSYLLLEYMHNSNKPIYFGNIANKNSFEYIGICENTLANNIKVLYNLKLVKKSTKEASVYLTSKSKTYLDKWLGNKEMYEKMFNQFWDVYPSKISKKNAKESFIKLPFSSEEFLLDEILKGIELRKKYEKNLPEKEFVPQWPHAQTYLNNRRWEDVFEVKKENNNTIVYKKKTKEIL